MKNTCLQTAVFLFLILQSALTVFGQERDTFRIAFGSCGKQNHPLPIFDAVVQCRPDLFIFLGDNIYGDTRNMEVLKDKYRQLAEKPSFQHLKKNVPIIATWDDHDYGQNDAGKNYPFKKESKEIFLQFFEEPENSDRRKRDGIYTGYHYAAAGLNIQVILLDGRTFRDNLKKNITRLKIAGKTPYRPDYLPHKDTTKTLLGEKQWAWLETELRKPADVRIIGSGTQFGIEYNGYESWANFPHEQKRMLELIKKTRAEGVVFITGDVHYAECSKMEPGGLYSIYDFTSSGLSSTWPFATPNANRIAGPIMENHFGLLTVSKDSVIAQIWDVNNQKRMEQKIALRDLKF